MCLTLRLGSSKGLLQKKTNQKDVCTGKKHELTAKGQVAVIEKYRRARNFRGLKFLRIAKSSPTR